MYYTKCYQENILYTDDCFYFIDYLININKDQSLSIPHSLPSLLSGKPAPAHFVTSSAIVLNLLTMPQQRHYQSLLDKSPSPSSSLVSSPAHPKSGSISSYSSLPSQRQYSTISETPSERSLESRISARPYPDDAAYGKGGLLGLADCMSSKQKAKS